MIRYSSRVAIERPPADVFAVLLDGPRYGEWTEMQQTRFDGPGSPRIGTRGSFVFPKGLLKGNYDMEITALEPDRQLEFNVTGPAVLWKAVMGLDPKGGHTELTYAGEVSMRGWRRLFEPLMAGEVRKGEAREAEQLKALLEAG